MTEPILQREVRIKRIIVLDKKAVQALSDPVRIRILEVLAHKPMSAEEVTRSLGSMGQEKAVTTIRHHLDALKTAGLIETTKMIEVRGAVRKYYAPVVKIFDPDRPSSIDDTQAKLIQETSSKLLKILKGIVTDRRFQSESEKNSITCPLCKGSHSKEKALLELLNSSLARAMESGDYTEFVSAGKEARSGGAKASSSS
jgi:DNA-binding transcriptional ArsR family regulator